MNFPYTLLFFLSLLYIPQTKLLAQDSLAHYSLAELELLHKKATKKEPKIRYALAMLERGEKELNTNDTAYAILLYEVGNTFRRAGDFKKAPLYLQKAIDILKIKAPKNIAMANSLNSLGTTYYRSRALDKAKKYWQESMQIRKELLGNRHPDYATSLSDLGILYWEEGDYTKAESMYIEALSIRKEVLGDKHPDYAMILNNMGLLYADMKDYEKAEPIYIQAMNLNKELRGADHPEYAKSLNNLANLYMNKNAYEKAEGLYIQAMNIQKDFFGDRHPSYANTINNLGVLYNKTGNYEKAETLYLKSMSIAKELVGEKHPFYINGLGNLGLLYDDMGAYSKAEQFYIQAKESFKEVFGETHPEYLQSINNIGEFYKNRNQIDLAWEQALLAIQINSALNMSPYATANVLDSFAHANYIAFDKMNISLGIVYDLLGKSKSPESKTQQSLIIELALELLDRYKNDLAGESDKLRILSENSEWVQNALQLQSKEDPAKALNIVEKNKSVLLLDAMSIKEAYIAGLLPDALIQEEKDLQKQYVNSQAALAENRSESVSDSIRSVLMTINLALDKFQQRIKKEYPKYAAMRYQYNTIKTAEIQASLDNKSALLEYLVGDSIVYIFYVDKNQVKIHEFEVTHKNLKQRIKSLHDALSNYSLLTKEEALAYQAYTKQAYWFYENLLAPALANSKGIKQLIIITDGELGHLPFEAFLVEAAPDNNQNYQKLHYLLNDYAISYNYSATLWKENNAEKNRKNNSKIFGMAANYEIALDPSKLDWRLARDRNMRGHLDPLPAAREEVETLAKSFQGYFAFDTLASEKHFKEKAANFGVIHLAMHGLLNTREPVLSSLAFTELGDSSENNFLCAYEIAQLELNADLVVLSACETGFGKFERGNGIASLARSFMYAGVPSMVVSLWQVNDYATSKIMQNFYANIADGVTKDEAIRQAKLAYIQSTNGIAAHPAFWSPFIVIGNTSPIKIAKKTSGQWLWWSLGLVGVLTVGGFALRKQKRKAA